MPNLFSHDFSGSFNQNSMIEQCLDMSRFGGERRSGHEVDFTFGENELDVLVVFNILRSQGFGSRTEPRRQIAQKLGIVDKYIDVLTETVSVASHEHGAAAECPVIYRYSDV